MSCNCTKAKPLPSCFNTLIIGDVADTAKTYLAIFKTPDGRVDIYEAFNVYGTTQMAISAINVRTGTNYEVSLVDAEAANLETTTSLIYGNMEANCIQLEFYQVFIDNKNEVFITETVTLA